MLNISALNAKAPSISFIASQSANVNTKIIVPYTVSYSNYDSLTISVKSYNKALIPEDKEHIISEGSGFNRTLKITPVEDEQGSAIISLEVTDTEGLSDFVFFKVTIIQKNRSPILLSDQKAVLSSINEDVDSIKNNGNTIEQILQNINIFDEDEEFPKKAIAVTKFDDTNGAWQFSTNNGNTWSNFSAIPNREIDISNNPRLLDGTLTNENTHRIRFIPNSNFNGSSAFIFHAWDKTQGNAGKSYEVVEEFGGSSAFSENSCIASISVNPINDPPTICLTANKNQDAYQNASSNSISFTVNDIDTDLSKLIITTQSRNINLFSGDYAKITSDISGYYRELIVTPNYNEIGDSIITIAVSDSEYTAYTYFNIKVLDNIPPVISIVKPFNNSYCNNKPFEIRIDTSDNGSGVSNVDLLMTDGTKYLYQLQNSNSRIFSDKKTSINVKFDEFLEYWIDVISDNLLFEGKQYTITVISTDNANNEALTSVTFKYGNEPIEAEITCELSKNSITFGDNLTISGSIIIDPPNNNIYDVEIIIKYRGEPEKYAKESVSSNTDGYFYYNLKCDNYKIDRAGTWDIKAVCIEQKGIKYSESLPQTLIVNKAKTSISIEVLTRSIKYGHPLSISGKLTPLNEECQILPKYLPIDLIFSNEDAYTRVSIKTENQYGRFILNNYSGLYKLGTWNVKAKFSGNKSYSNCETFPDSDYDNIRVVKTQGYAIIVQGKTEKEEGIDSYIKTTNNVYKRLIDRGLNDDDIIYFSNANNLNESNNIIIDEKPSIDKIKNAITITMKNKINDSPGNLFLIMVDHGKNESFFVENSSENGKITSNMLKDWLKELEDSLDDSIHIEIIVVLGFCKSGSFINELSGDRRVIVTSSGVNEVSFKGPFYENEIREGEFFIAEFFNHIAYGNSIKESFEYAAKLTHIYTYSDSAEPQYPYYDKSLQHPLLDDNGDEIGSHILLAFSSDGFKSKDLYIGVSKLSVNNSDSNFEEVSILNNSIIDNLFIKFDQKYQDLEKRLTACVDKPERLKAIWIEIKPPDYSPVYIENEQLEMNLTKIPGDINNECDTWFDLGEVKFDIPGLYQIFYFAKDNLTNNISSFKESKVYKDKKENLAPYSFELLSPEPYPQGSSDIGKTVQLPFKLIWEEAEDPDKDRVSYILSISSNRSFTDIVFKTDNNKNNYEINSSIELKDDRDYYWKVEAVDEYGKKYESSDRIFHTAFNQNKSHGFFQGMVINYFSKNKLDDFIIIAKDESGDEEDIDIISQGCFLEELSIGNYTISVLSNGFYPIIIKNVNITKESAPKNNIIELIPILTKKNNISLIHLLIALKALAGIELYDNDLIKAADVNYDKKIGFEELNFIINNLSIPNL